MLELALHILDIVENSVRARAKNISIEITESVKKDRLSIVIQDDGDGMARAVLERTTDPFYTTKTVRKVGLGLPMLEQAAGNAGGALFVESEEGAGTRLSVDFQLSHIDRQPLGDIAGVMATMIAGNDGLDIKLKYKCGDRVFDFDTKQIKKQINGIPIQRVEVLKWIRQYIDEGLKEIGAGA